MFKLSVAAALGGLFAMPALASQDVPATATVAPAPAAAATSPKDPDPVICRIEKNTGSRLQSTKSCMTRSQWDARAAESRNSIKGRAGSTGTSINSN